MAIDRAWLWSLSSLLLSEKEPLGNELGLMACVILTATGIGLLILVTAPITAFIKLLVLRNFPGWSRCRAIVRTLLVSVAETLVFLVAFTLTAPPTGFMSWFNVQRCDGWTCILMTLAAIPLYALPAVPLNLMLIRGKDEESAGTGSRSRRLIQAFCLSLSLPAVFMIIFLIQ